MKILTTIGSGSLIFFILCSVVGCTGEGDSDVAPMEKMEKEALYSTIQGFVGTWWNGSDLYPDPCGWTPIQVPNLPFIYFLNVTNHYILNVINH